MSDSPLHGTPEHLLWTALRMIGVKRLPEFSHELGSCDTFFFASIDGQDAAMFEVYAGEATWPTVHDVHFDLQHPVVAQALQISVTDYPYAVHLAWAGQEGTFPKQGERSFIGGTWFDLHYLTLQEVADLRAALAAARSWQGLVGREGPTVLRCGTHVAINGVLMEQCALEALAGESLTVPKSA